MQGRGSEALTNQGDPLMATGIDERKVPIDFAKGVSDQVKRNYWDIDQSHTLYNAYYEVLTNDIKKRQKSCLDTSWTFYLV
jgi:hypothetical protein